MAEFSSTEQLRQQFVQTYIAPMVTDSRVVTAFQTIPREIFVPAEFQSAAYQDRALPIGAGQTISQPSLVAQMTELLQLTGTETVLEIGTGSGYQAAILSHLAKQVYSIERLDVLAQQARERFKQLNITNVVVIVGDGAKGYQSKAPFDAIIITATTPQVPQPLIEQLKENGRLVVPLGNRLMAGTKLNGALHLTNHGLVEFVPLITSHQ
ncbi:MAG: Protein-L-isoaspartate O-methyltransferase [Candidatus Pacebacteria bacterium GW2011_GWB1_47_8]|nr:MAG: Protein-L-isoaspartate O-methyltransferase [Candidatus Pacebacteria bacterium GW2011_GWA1_46_10]KKU84247.1 MAG: Protein-L-isoaspartate O-methyltransferase [Candidatus Pacebacteria bacterium GW2011_GWB1_47_8]HCR81467.1 protein-L-isoaspartate O-methyltransferase [Candidatus Paceibacterota bacterium]